MYPQRADVPSGYFFKPFDDFANFLRDTNQHRDNGLSREGLTLCERYIEGGVNLLAVFRDPARPSLLPVCEFRYRPKDDWTANKRQVGETDCWGRRVQLAQVQQVDRKGGNGCSNDSMLVEDIDFMEQGEIVTLPSRVRLYFINCFDDLWSGELYLSISDGAHKSARRFGKWELDPVGGWRVVGTDQIPDDVVKGGMEIVRSIPDQESDGVLRGFVAFDKYSALTGCGIVADGDPSATSTKSVPLSFDLIDMMLGPL